MFVYLCTKTYYFWISILIWIKLTILKLTLTLTPFRFISPIGDSSLQFLKTNKNHGYLTLSIFDSRHTNGESETQNRPNDYDMTSKDLLNCLTQGLLHLLLFELSWSSAVESSSLMSLIRHSTLARFCRTAEFLPRLNPSLDRLTSIPLQQEPIYSSVIRDALESCNSKQLYITFSYSVVNDCLCSDVCRRELEYFVQTSLYLT